MDADAQIEALCKDAGCETGEELASAEERSTRLRTAKTRLEVVEGEIERLAFGTDREAFERNASETDPNTLPEKSESTDRSSGCQSVSVSCLPSPCERLSRAPTTTEAPSSTASFPGRRG